MRADTDSTPGISTSLLSFLRRHGLLAGVMLVALVARFYQLAEFPANLVCDECDNLREIYAIQHDGKPGLFDLDWKPQPAFSQHLSAWGVWLWGVNSQARLAHLAALPPGEERNAAIAHWQQDLQAYGDVFGLRFASAVISLLALLVFYRVVRYTLSKPAALTVTLLLALNPAWLNFSRSGWENIHICLATLLAVYGAMRLVWRQGALWGNVLLLAVGVAWGMYGYFAGKAVPMIALLSFVVLFVLVPAQRPWWRRLRWGVFWLLLAGPVLFWGPLWLVLPRPGWAWLPALVLTMVAAALSYPLADPVMRTLWCGPTGRLPRPGRVAAGYLAAGLLSVALFAPQLPTILRDMDRFTYRMKKVSSLHAALPWHGFSTRQQLLRDNTTNALLAPVYPQNKNPRYAPPGQPLLHPLLRPVFVIGIVAGAFAFARHYWWWLMLLVPLITSQVLTTSKPLTSGMPDWARGIALIPVVFYFVGVGLDRLNGLWYGLGQRRWPLVLAGVTLVAAVQSVQNYAVWQRSVVTVTRRGPGVMLAKFPEWCMWQHVLLRDHHKTGNCFEWRKARGKVVDELRTRPQDTPQASKSAAVRPQQGRPSLLIPPVPAGVNEAALQETMRTWLKQHQPARRPPRRDDFPAQGPGLYLGYFNNTSWSGKAFFQGRSPDAVLGVAPERPFSVEWSGRLHVPRAGMYFFAVLCDDGAMLSVQGHDLLRDTAEGAERLRVVRKGLQRGAHSIRIRYFQERGALAFALFWKVPGGEWEPVPARAFRGDLPVTE